MPLFAPLQREISGDDRTGVKEYKNLGKLRHNVPAVQMLTVSFGTGGTTLKVPSSPLTICPIFVGSRLSYQLHCHINVDGI